jgi:hypothetical protein
VYAPCPIFSHTLGICDPFLHSFFCPTPEEDPFAAKTRPRRSKIVVPLQRAIHLFSLLRVPIGGNLRGGLDLGGLISMLQHSGR